MTRNLRMSVEEYEKRFAQQSKNQKAIERVAPDIIATVIEVGERAVKRMQAANPSFALGRLKSGTMNKTEAEYAQRLEYGKHTGAILWYKFEAITLKLADDTRYTPDFAVLIAGGEFQLHEVKGFWQDDAKVKIKVAASMFPFRFIAVRKLPKKEGGGWQNQEF